ncbi:MAG: cell envelope integrity protein TolA [Hyphomicrobiaceae bacterium]
MRVGLVISALLHAALLAWALVTIAETHEMKLPQPDPIIAEVVSADELNRMRQGSRDAKLDVAKPKEVPKPDEAKKEIKRPRPTPPPPPAAAAEPPPPPPEPETKVAKVEPPPPPAPAPPKPVVKPEPDKASLDRKLEELALQQAAEEKAQAEAKAKAEAAAKAKAQAEAKAKAEAEAKAKAKAKAREKAKALAKARAEKAKAAAKAKAEAKAKADRLAREKAKLDTSRLSALLDKTPDPKQAPAAAPQTQVETKNVGPVRGDRDGRDHVISANEASFLAGLMRQAVSRCWNINAGLDGIDKVVVKIEVRLNRDGQINGQPRIANPQNSPVFRDAADSAMRALVQCAPYELPPDKYQGGWEHMIVVFDPARMF